MITEIIQSSYREQDGRTKDKNKPTNLIKRNVNRMKNNMNIQKGYESTKETQKENGEVQNLPKRESKKY